MCHYPSDLIVCFIFLFLCLYQFSCCLSCLQFCGSTLCRNSSTGQGRREGHLYKWKANWLTIHIEVVKRMFRVTFFTSRNLHLGFQGCRCTEEFLLLRSVKNNLVIKEASWGFRILFSVWFGRLS